MTPYRFYNNDVSIWQVGANGILTGIRKFSVAGSILVRPSVSLKPGIKIVSVDGISDTLYVVE